MQWMTLNVHRRDEDAEWLRAAFPVNVNDFDHRYVAAPTRQIDWTLRTPDVRAWVEMYTGSMVLVEAVGSEEGGAGYVTARLWFAPASRQVTLTGRLSFVNDEEHPGTSHQQVQARVLAAVVARVPGLPSS